jgi:hypothetical protein
VRGTRSGRREFGQGSGPGIRTCSLGLVLPGGNGFGLDFVDGGEDNPGSKATSYSGSS